ncbi:MAG: hypothetical protein IT355_03230 [Gemmatimonadaceae bacterium]|nr:hypothetical protein [Gemmatimonadaceae bacterium]
MRELTKFEVQDLLPDLLHDRLDADLARSVRAAVEADAELAAELALLRTVHASRRAAPVLDIGRIVAALPPAPSMASHADPAPVLDDLAARRAARRPAISQRFARAAALLVVVGGGTLATIYGTGRDQPVTTPAVTTAESVAVAGETMQLGLGTSTDELSVEQLRALEDDIRALDGIPSAEPESGMDLMAGEGA